MLWTDPFDALFAPLGAVGQRPAAFMPPTDLAVSGGDLVLTMDLPGLRAEDVAIEVRDGHLVVRGERRRPEVAEGTSFAHAERTFGRFERRLKLPDGVDPDTVTASMDEGVLSLIVPQARAAQAADHLRRDHGAPGARELELTAPPGARGSRRRGPRRARAPSGSGAHRHPGAQGVPAGQGRAVLQAGAVDLGTYRAHLTHPGPEAVDGGHAPWIDVPYQEGRAPWRRVDEQAIRGGGWLLRSGPRGRTPSHREGPTHAPAPPAPLRRRPRPLSLGLAGATQAHAAGAHDVALQAGAEEQPLRAEAHHHAHHHRPAKVGLAR